MYFFPLINLFKWYKNSRRKRTTPHKYKVYTAIFLCGKKGPTEWKQWEDFTLKELDEFWEAAKVEL